MSGALITKAERGSKDLTETCDVVIVGTGPSGSTAARVLSEAGWDVVMVEEGAPFPTHLRRSDAWNAFKHGWRDQSFQVAQGRAVTPFLQGRALGGGTPVNGAIIHRMPEVIHQLWDKMHGLGDALSYADLDRIYDRLDAELHVAPTPQEAWGGNNDGFRKAADALGWQSNPTKRAVVGCERTSQCNQGCPGGRKQSMDQTYLPRVISEGARIYTECRVDKVVHNGQRATGVVGSFRDPIKGRSEGTLTVHARKAVILAAGAIHTPGLLRSAGIARRAPLIGRRLQAHPGASIMAVFDDPVGLFDGAAQGYESTQFWGERMKFEVVGLPPAVAVQRMPGFGPELMERVGRLGHVAHWGCQIRARTQGSVRPSWFGGPSIRWSLKPTDVALFKQAFWRLTEMAFAAGARSVWPGIAGVPREIHHLDQLQLGALPDDPTWFHSICAHLFGTASMGTDPRGSVVQTNGETWAMPGLHVVDASVFPTNMGVNPQHTICAVAWRMAEHMTE